MENITEIKKAIVNEMLTELEGRNYTKNCYAIEKIIERNFEAKKDLAELLSKHPNWIPEKRMIQFDIDIEREIDIYGVQRFADWLYYKAKQNCNDESKLWKLYRFIYNTKTQFFNQEENSKTKLDEINALNENYKLRTNMKCSKAIGKICREEGWDKLEGFNQRYASFCDCLNPLKITRHTLISINPLDYLLMSHGNSWSSCHDIGEYDYEDDDRYGCYSSGTISYMLDNHSFIFYTVDASYNGDKIELEPKIQRQVFGYNDEVLVQLRLYPQSNDSGAKLVYDNIRAIVQKIIADCLGKPNMWIKSTSDVEDVVSDGDGATCYPDWEDGNPGSAHCSVSTLKDRADGKENRSIVFGAKPICIGCGYAHDLDGCIMCDECQDEYEEDDDDYVACECCGDSIDRDYAHWVNGNPYCDDCVTQCDDCGSYCLNSDISYIDGHDVCPDCIANGDYYLCEHCGDLQHISEMIETKDDHKYCDYCADDFVFECEECEDKYTKESLHYDEDTDCLYCDECYEKLLKNRELEAV